jgi:flagellar protein FliL
MKLFKKKKKKEGAEGEEEKDEKEGAPEKEEPKEEAKEGEGKEGEAKEGEGEAAPKKSKKKIIIIGVLALVVLLGGAGGAYYAGMFGAHEEKAEGGMELDEEGKPILKVVYYTLPEFLVNLNVGGKQTSFLKTTIILELNKQMDVAMVEANLPRLLDAFNTYLRELRASDLAGSAGIQRLREELLLRANKALAPTKVNDVLFKEIVIQ